MIKEKILKNVKIAIGKLGVKEIDIDLQLPSNASFGDYSTSVALRLSKELKKNPVQIAEEIKKNLPKIEAVGKIDIVKPGFINFWIANDTLINRSLQTSDYKFELLEFHLGKNKKIMVEFAHPNTLKLFHIGHFR